MSLNIYKRSKFFSVYAIKAQSGSRSF